VNGSFFQEPIDFLHENENFVRVGFRPPPQQPAPPVVTILLNGLFIRFCPLGWLNRQLGQVPVLDRFAQVVGGLAMLESSRRAEYHELGSWRMQVLTLT